MLLADVANGGRKPRNSFSSIGRMSFPQDYETKAANQIMKPKPLKLRARLVLWGLFLFSSGFLVVLTWDVVRSSAVDGTVVEVLEVDGMKGVSYQPIVVFRYKESFLTVKTVMSSSLYDYEIGASVVGLYTENGEGRLYLWMEVVLAYVFLGGLGCALPLYMLKP